jgi:mono/diheme cytochrome c family protein
MKSIQQKHVILFFIISGIACSIAISACKMYYNTQRVDYRVSSDRDAIQEGKRLTMMTCAGCHYNPDTKKLTGIRMTDAPKIAGKIYSRNITQDPDKGIGRYTDGELVYLIRTGIARNGKLMPYMQRPNLANKDLNDIIAFLRSDDELVTPSKESPPPTHYSLFGKFGLSKYSSPLPYSDKKIVRPDLAHDKIGYGKYMVDNLSCFHCHSAGITKINVMEPEKSKRYMGGGFKMKTPGGEKILTPNLTFDETGIANWTEHDFIRAVKDGFNKDNAVLRIPMPKYTELTDEEAAAIYAYLKTIPKIKNKVPRK